MKISNFLFGVCFFTFFLFSSEINDFKIENILKSVKLNTANAQQSIAGNCEAK